MANASANENSSLNQNFDELNVVEFSSIDNSLLMSLLEDSPLEDGDDERLKIVIQSLEAEIMSQDSCLEKDKYEGCPEDYQFSDVEQLESCSASSDCHLEFERIDVNVAYLSPSNEKTGYSNGHFIDKKETMVELEGMGDYSRVCYGMAIAMDEDDYAGLWQ